VREEDGEDAGGAASLCGRIRSGQLRTVAHEEDGDAGVRRWCGVALAEASRWEVFVTEAGGWSTDEC